MFGALTFNKQKSLFSVSRWFNGYNVAHSFTALSMLVFCHSIPVTVVMTICVLLSPILFCGGLLSFVTVLLVRRIVGYESSRGDDCGLYNAVLTGMGIASFCGMSVAISILIVVCSILTMLLTQFLSSVMSHRNLPVMSLPFSFILMAICFLPRSGSTTLFVIDYISSVDSFLPVPLISFFSAMGTIIFLPYPVVGIVLFATVAYVSRSLAFHAVVAFIAGVLFNYVLVGSFGPALFSPFRFNYILVGFALGGVYCISSLRTTVITLAGACLCALIGHFSISISIMLRLQFFTIPFVVTVWIVLAVLRQSSYSDLNNAIRATPEESLIAHNILTNRFSLDEVSIGLPLQGEMAIYQGQDDVWTHKGNWKHAFDFVVQDSNGLTYCNEGAVCRDHYIFGQVVVSPVAGIVYDCYDRLHDNELGVVDQEHNWGNYIIIQTAAGWFVEISHLMQHSLNVKIGDALSLGMPIAKCGNSGFSPVPHLHIQVQSTGVVGGHTIPFNFALYQNGDSVACNGRPRRGDIISPVVFDDIMFHAFSFRPGCIYRYNIVTSDCLIDTFAMKVCRDDMTGAVYFEDIEKSARLYMTVWNGSYYVYDYIETKESYLKNLYIALPRLPLARGNGVCWTESLPLDLVFSGVQKHIEIIKVWWSRNYCPAKGEWKRNGSCVNGRISRGNTDVETSITLNESHGIENIVIDNLHMRLI